MKWIIIILGVLLFALGSLWFLQGTGLLTVAPIACVGECKPLEGPSMPWAVAGAAVMAIGGAIILFAGRR